jgi:hypothetical protein
MGTQLITEERHAIMGIDPGGTTGVAAAYVRSLGTLKESLLAATQKKSVEVKGDWLHQATMLATMMVRFQYRANVEHSIPMPNIHFAIEDYVLRLPATNKNLAPVWVAASTVALYTSIVRMSPGDTGFEIGDRIEEITWQQPSQIKRFASNDRLKLWGLYTTGSEHERDAWRHVATKANSIV